MVKLGNRVLCTLAGGALAVSCAVFGASLAPVQPAEAAKATSIYTWKASVAPRYVKVTGKAKVKKKPARGKIRYSALDSLGRARTARGTITYRQVARSAGWRELMPDYDPSGWSTNRQVAIKLYTGGTYHGYFWNRSHLIADSLGGHAIPRNLVTGTRMQNVGANDGNGGMAYCETRVRDWLYAHRKGSVYYSARPVYKGGELVCRSVVVDMKSSDGSIDQRVIVYNAANGYKINYKTGSYRKTGSKGYAVKKPRKASKSGKPRASKNTHGAHKGGLSSKKVWITATGKRYHLRKSCSGLMNANRTWKVSLAKAKANGLTPCRICA